MAGFSLFCSCYFRDDAYVSAVLFFGSDCLTVSSSLLFYFYFCGDFNFVESCFVDGNNCAVSMAMICLVLICTLCWVFGVSN